MTGPLFLLPFFQKWRFRAGRNTEIKPEARECLLFMAECRGAILEGKLRAQVVHIGNEYGGDHRKTFGALMLGMGKTPGAFDYIVVGEGGARALWVEFKRPQGTGATVKPGVKRKQQAGELNPNQKIFRRWCEFLSIPHAVAYTAAEGIAILKAHHFFVEK